jgi:competence protein ComEA
VAAVLEGPPGLTPEPLEDESLPAEVGAEVEEEVVLPAESDAPDQPVVAPRPAPPDRAGDRRSLLPASLRSVRTDPGRSGALGLVAVAVVAALVAGGVLLRGRPQEVRAPEVLASGSPLPGASAPADGIVVVAVAGKVRKPGLVRLPAGSRVDDALRAAGGLLPGTSPGLLNLARRLVDGEQVLVGVGPPPTAPGAAKGTAGEPLDLNTATADDLDELPGVGPVLAGRIIDWRTEHGRFASIDQLREVSGIGEATYGNLKNRVRV